MYIHTYIPKLESHRLNPMHLQFSMKYKMWSKKKKILLYRISCDFMQLKGVLDLYFLSLFTKIVDDPG